MKAALLNDYGKVIGEVLEAPISGYSIKIAGAFTRDGEPVNVKTYKISRSKINLKKAQSEQPVLRVKDIYTFECAEEGSTI